MILDRIENAVMYRAWDRTSPGRWIIWGRADFADLAPGRYELDGDRVFALVSQLQLKPVAEALWERTGSTSTCSTSPATERMGRASLRSDVRVTQPYDAQADAALYDVSGDIFTVGQGSFVIFAPKTSTPPASWLSKLRFPNSSAKW